MDEKEILAWYESDDERSIWGFMYGMPTEYNGSVKDALEEWKKNELHLSSSKDSFYVIWGGPGPDFNIYKLSDYGKTWAFTIEEIDMEWAEQYVREHG